MTSHTQEALGGAQKPSSGPIRNPYIVNFCRVLVERKGEKLDPDVMKKLLEDMYRLFECMLGQNMIDALPDALRERYQDLTKDLSKLSYEKIGEIFDENVPEYDKIMKETMKQFAEIYMKNRVFDPTNYPVPAEVLQS